MVGCIAKSCTCGDFPCIHKCIDACYPKLECDEKANPVTCKCVVLPETMHGSWGNTSFAHCKLNYTLHQLRQRESTGQPPKYRTGGLGRKMQSSIFEAWVCVDQHECFSRTSDAMDDWFCWVITRGSFCRRSVLPSSTFRGDTTAFSNCSTRKT
jgi:hypothetical protein